MDFSKIQDIIIPINKNIVSLFERTICLWRKNKLTDLLLGKFSISELQYVKFTRGNLFYNSVNSTWGLETSQDNFATSYDIEHISHFFHTSSGNYGADLTWNTDWKQDTNIDWGIPYNEQHGTNYHTLSKGEWDYLLNTRIVNGSTGMSYTWQYVEYNSINGTLIYHDDYTGTRYGNHETITEIPEGCLFLPFAGKRAASQGSISNVGTQGDYWNLESSNLTSSYYLRCLNTSINPNVTNVKSGGMCIRLAQKFDVVGITIDSGYPFFDTEYLPTTKTKVVMKIKFGAKRTSTYLEGMLVDSSGGYSSVENAFGFNFGGDRNQYLYEIFLWAGVNGLNYGDKIDSVAIPNLPNSTRTFTFGYENGTQIFRVDNQSPHTLKYPKTKDNTSYTMHLFGGLWEGEPYTFDQADFALYSFNIYENDVLIYGYVPQKINGVWGLYDELNEKFLTPIGGTFKKEGSLPNNEIWYTSTDGNVVTPASTTGFGASIVSNTYTDGKGIIKFDGDVTTIVKNAFSNKTTLSSIEIPNAVTIIDEMAFNSCYNLTSVNIPNSVTDIKTGAFIHCKGLTSIEIPSSVTNIGGYGVFYNCIGLTSVTCLATTPPTLGTTVFDNTNNCPIYVPSESVNAYKTATNWSTYASGIQAITT